MRRYRRNEEEAPRPDPLAGRYVLGLVINPKTKEPLLAVTDKDYVGIRNLRPKRGAKGFELLAQVGVGYYADSDDEASRAAGLPRSHTPSGVKDRGGGYGTVLYTSLCLGAHLVNENQLSISMGTEGDGICSESNGRSDAADRWWNAAARRGLTETEEGDDETEESDLDGEISPSALGRCMGRDDISYINTISVDITKPGITVDTYRYDSALDHALVAAAIPMRVLSIVPREGELRWIWQEVLKDPSEIFEVDRDALLALDVRGLDPEIVNLLSLCYLKAGLDETAVDGLRMRWEHDLDPGTESRQIRLFPNGADMEEVIEARSRVPWTNLEDLP